MYPPKAVVKHRNDERRLHWQCAGNEFLIARTAHMRIAVLLPIAWRTPPRHYGPWELFASLLTEGLVALGHQVTLFATADSRTNANLVATSST